MKTAELLPVRQGEKWGFKDGGGRMAIAARFDGVGSFSEGLARVKVGKKWGFIDMSGQMVIEARFNQAGIFIDGQAKVKLGGQWVMINRSGLPVEAVDANTFVDKTGKMISEEEYRDWGKMPGYKNTSSSSQSGESEV